MGSIVGQSTTLGKKTLLSKTLFSVEKEYWKYFGRRVSIVGESTTIEKKLFFSRLYSLLERRVLEIFWSKEATRLSTGSIVGQSKTRGKTKLFSKTLFSVRKSPGNILVGGSDPTVVGQSTTLRKNDFFPRLFFL